jgi:hypothetical protein
MESNVAPEKSNLFADRIAKVLVIMTKMSDEDRQDATLYWNTTVAQVLTQAMQENDNFIRSLSPFSNMVCHQVRNSFPCMTNMITTIGCDTKSVNFLDYNAMEPRFVNGMLLISDKASDPYFSDVISTKVVMSMWLHDFMSHLFFLTNKFYETVFPKSDHPKQSMHVIGDATHKHSMETFFPHIVQWSILRDRNALHHSQFAKGVKCVTRQTRAELDSTDVLLVPVYEGPLSPRDVLLACKDEEGVDGPPWGIWSG